MTTTVYRPASSSTGDSSITGDLSVTGNASVTQNVTVDTDTFFVDSVNNKVGVRNLTPSTELDVAGDITLSGGVTRLLLIEAGTDSAANLRVEFPDNATTPADIRLFRTTNTSAGAKLQIYKADNTSSINHSLVSNDHSYLCGNNSSLGVGVTIPLGKQHLRTTSIEAIPCVILEQRDVSEEFMRLIGTSTVDASLSLVDAVNLTTPGSIVGWFKVYIEDIQATDPIPDGVYYVPFYSAPTA